MSVYNDCKYLRESIESILAQTFSNFEFINYLQCPTPQFQNELQTSDIKFVTPDSINLVYESLSSNGQTYLIKLQNSRFNKLFKKTFKFSNRY